MGMNFSGCRLDGTHNHSSQNKDEQIHDNFSRSRLLQRMLYRTKAIP